MKITAQKIILFGLVAVFITGSVHSQDIITDTSTIWRIETKDGNEFFGPVVSQDSSIIRLQTTMLGVINIPVHYITSKTLVNQAVIKQGEVWMKNLQAARYFYSPNGYGLEKGAGYYQNTWVLFNQVSYGITNYFTLGAGMMPLFLFGGEPTPVWITPKFSVPVIKNKVSLGAGLLVGEVVGADMLTFGIGYGVATVGNRDMNLTAGFGYAFTDESFSRPILNISGMLRFGKRSYLLTENYYIALEGEDAGIISIGGRTVWPKLSLDYGLFTPINLAEVFIAIPWLGFTIPIGWNKIIKK